MKRAEFFLAGRPRLPRPYHLKGIGLPNIHLLSGVKLEDDADYGPLVTIENLQGLLHAIGLHIIEKPGPMTGAEFRFLRKQMDLTQAQLAERLRVTDQTIANYEKGKTAAGPADVMMRVLYALHVLPPGSMARAVKALVEATAEKKTSVKLPQLPRRKIAGKWQEHARLVA
jgi:transcriptional regulator with XRE-family HTH domain